MIRLEAAAVLAGLTLVACGGGGGATTSAAGANAGTGGDETSLSGSGATTSVGGSTGAAGNGGGGAGGAGGPAAPSAEFVSELCADLRYVTVIDDEHIFESCFESTTVNNNHVEQFTLSQLTSSGPTPIATSAKPIKLLAMDTKNYYIQEFQTFDGTNTWDGEIKALPLGTTALQPFYRTADTNSAPDILHQTDDLCVISQPKQNGLGNNVTYFASVIGVSKATNAVQVIVPSMQGFLETSWLQDDTLGFVFNLPDGPTVFRGSLSAGTATKAETLPNLCKGFVRRGDGFVTLCGDTADVVLIDGSGKQTTLASGVPGYSLLYSLDRVYWVSDITTTPILHAVDDAGTMAQLPLAPMAYVATLTSSYAYVQVKESGKSLLRRAALSDVK